MHPSCWGLSAAVRIQEAPLDFMPTYKYKNGTHDYDHKRAPAWTDRILWKSSKDRSQRIKCLSYGRHELLASDHRPVTAVFQARGQLWMCGGGHGVGAVRWITKSSTLSVRRKS